MIHCIECGSPYPEDSIPFSCPSCQGVYTVGKLPAYNPDKFSPEPGIWRYRYSFGLPSDSPCSYLGEGDIPLVWKKISGYDISFKLEFLNPTGSFKDRGTAVLLSFLLSRGVGEVMDDSSGNAGSSLAAYAASAGIKARIFVPAYASGPKRKQISSYGVDVVQVPGMRSGAKDAVLEAANKGGVYASHALLPHGMPGYATAAYEIFEQIGGAPGTVIMPIGQGNLLLSMSKAFASIFQAGIIDKVPQLIGVQASACAPIWKVFTTGESDLSDIEEGETVAEGVRTLKPYRLSQIINVIEESSGTILAVDEGEILKGQSALASLGLYVEPTSAVVWNAIGRVVGDVPEPIVVILTGSGLKSI